MRKIKIGRDYDFYGAKFSFEYSFHSIPCLRVKVDFMGKKFFLSGDTFYNPVKLAEI